MVDGGLPISSVWDRSVLLSGSLHTAYNLLLCYSVTEGVPGIAAVIANSGSVWFAMLDYLVLGKLITYIDLVAIALLTAGSFLASLSD